MAWSDQLNAQRGNLTSLMNTLAQLKEQKKNRWMGLLETGLNIGSQFGGAALQNKWSKAAADTEYGRQQAADTLAHERSMEGERLRQQGENLLQTIRGAQSKSAEEQRNANELALEQMRINAGAYARGGGGETKEDLSKLVPFDIASQAWDSWWDRLMKADPQRKMKPEDFDQFRAVAVQQGARYGFSSMQMEDAVNTLAQSYGFNVAPAGEATGAASPATPPVVRYRPTGIAGHAAATAEGVTQAAKGIAGEAKKAWSAFKGSFGGKQQKINERTVLKALADAKKYLPTSSELSAWESEVRQKGNLDAPRLKEIMDGIGNLLAPFVM
jgi:hypothetical protein